MIVNEKDKKWRGITTTQIPKYELKAKTIVNRFNQKSLSLPRIDDKKRWAGYAGNTGISRKLARLVPKCDVYCEPFAGTAKVFQELCKMKKQKFQRVVLNDKSKFIYKWLIKELKTKKIPMLVWNVDFARCIADADIQGTSFFLIDPPWSKSLYDQIFSQFDRESVRKYDEELLDQLKFIQGKFMITSAKNNTIMKKSGFYNWYVRSEYVVSGTVIEDQLRRVLICDNVGCAILQFTEEKIRA
jgi:site-specific DNA-adenine methylase